MTDTTLAAAPPRSLYRTIRTVHKWAGLTALAWLSVLGLTGVVLDHHEWRWVNQVTVPEWVTSDRINRLVRGTIMRHVEVDPGDPARWVGASERGLWRTGDFGATWAAVPFEGYDRGRPQVLSLLPDPAQGWARLWLATDDGLWTLAPDDTAARRFAMDGHVISYLNPGATPTELLGVEDKSHVFRIATDSPDNIAWYDLSPARIDRLAETVSLFRFTLDLHVGEGFLPQPLGILVNDYGGLAIGILAFTGLLFWGLPRYWRGRKPIHPVKRRQQVLRWLFRFHGPVIGLLAVVPILYVSLTGLVLNHVIGFSEWANDIELDRASLTPAYQLMTFDHEIESAVTYWNAPDRLTISTRLGVLDSRDGGQSWTFAAALADASAREGGDPAANSVKLRRRGDTLFAMSAPTNLVSTDGTTWQPIDGPTLSMTDVARIGDRWFAKSSRGIYEGRIGEPFTLTDFQVPPLSGTPFFLFLADIHVGAIFHDQWKWVNDLVSVLAIVLVISGVVTWWRRKWM